MDIESWLIVIVGAILIIFTVFYYIFTKRIEKTNSIIELTIKETIILMKIKNSIINRKIEVIHNHLTKHTPLPDKVSHTQFEKDLIATIRSDRDKEWIASETIF